MGGWQAEWYNRIMWVKLLLLFFVFSFLLRTDFAFDQDLGRHIKLGEIIVSSHTVPRTNLFSYTNGDFPFINTHWLFEVWTYVVGKFPGGVEGLLVRKIIIILFSVFLIFKIIPKGNRALMLPVAFIFLHVLRERLELRPEIFSFLFTAVTLSILERFLKQKTRWIYLLPVIQLIWINTHIYFFVGLILQVIYILHLLYQKLRFHPKGGNLKVLLIIFVLSVLSSMLNPNGLTGFLYPLNVGNNYGYTIVENQTMFLLESINFHDPNFIFVKLSLMIAFLGLIFTLIKKRFDPKNILIAFFGGGLALLNVRSFPYLFFLSLPTTLWNFGEIKTSRFTQILAAFTGILLLAESFFYLNGDYYKYTDSQHQVGLSAVESVKGAMDFTLANNLPGPIFNNFDIGSYILYRGYPKYKVFVDGRPEAYPKEFFQNTYIPMQSDYQRFKLEEVKWNFKTIIFSHTDQTPWGRAFLQNVIKDKDWKTVYIDDFVIVLVKEGVLKDNGLKEVDLSKLSADMYHFSNHISYIRLGSVLLETGNASSGADFIRQSQVLFPNSPALGSQSYFFW